jgi:[ribosomal protein S5]-alanine N-acetyltransferase
MTYNLETICTSRMLLHRPTLDDLDDLIRMNSDPRVMATLGGVRTPEVTRGYLDRQVAHWEEYGFGWWIMRQPESGQFIGRGGIRWVHIDGRDLVEVGYGLMSEFWGQGLATELARESLRIAYTVIYLPEVVSFTLPTNLASRRVMEKIGLRYDKDTVYADLPHVLYRQTAQEWNSQQSANDTNSR